MIKGKKGCTNPENSTRNFGVEKRSESDSEIRGRSLLLVGES